MDAFEVPASVTVVDGDTLRDAHLGVNLSEGLGAVPGLVARNRQNYAQDEQVQIRGFGARSSFGLRGVRVIVDGIPSTLPDGQGWVSNVDLGSVDRVEVLRGPYSALYGNASGGLIAVFTRPGRGPATVTTGFAAGNNGQVRESTKLTGSSGIVGYDLDLTHFQTDGYRAHSAATRNFGNLRLDFAVDAASNLMLVVNSVASPTAQDPLGLTRAEFAANPRGVDPAAIKYNTRKSFDQTQIGLAYDRKLDAADDLAVRVYKGDRNAEQFQAITVGAQTPSSPGGVIDLGRTYSGGDAHWTRRMLLAATPLTATAGVSYDALDEVRLGHLNYTGPASNPTALGVAGALRRSQANGVRDFDQYAQMLWQFLPAWNLSAGLRHSSVRFGSNDNPTKPGGTVFGSSASYTATLPVAGLEFAASDAVRVFANAGKGFETPTLNEMAYRSGTARGLNFALQPDRSHNYELGVRTRTAAIGQFDAALFHITTRDEIVTQTNSGGHAVYQNAGRSQRDGLELSWLRDLGGAWRATLAYTLINARYKDAFLTCLTTPCPIATTLVGAGNQIPAIARSSGYVELAWRPAGGWDAGVEARAASQLYANDVNSQSAPGYAIGSLRVGYRAALGHWNVRTFARIDNVFDRRYAGSVIVDETSLRFFETAPGRSGLIGASGAWTF
jgi:iron complex outermembrane receptor protein